ncbi:MAG: hypothetical protein EOO27_02325 [Comamonadaceae bacterium]|nr:MAG: hypothetical protein EOO27_02325 [Comamonadaceae bacterium]
MDILFGTKKTVKTLDNDESTEITMEKYRDGVVEQPVKIIYSINIRVRNALEEAAEFHKFSKEYNSDPTMRNPSTAIVRSQLGNKNGFYYFVKSWETTKH